MSKFSRKEALAKLNAYRAISKFLWEPQYVVNIVRNIKSLEDEELVMRVAQEQAQKVLQEYEKKRVKICTDDAVKGPDGNPQVAGNKYVFPTAEIEQEVNKKLAGLQLEYAPAFVQHAEFIKQLEVLLAEEVEYELKKIKMGGLKEAARPELFEAILEELED